MLRIVNTTVYLLLLFRIYIFLAVVLLPEGRNKPERWHEALPVFCALFWFHHVKTQTSTVPIKSPNHEGIQGRSGHQSELRDQLHSPSVLMPVPHSLDDCVAIVSWLDISVRKEFFFFPAESRITNLRLPSLQPSYYTA